MVSVVLTVIGSVLMTLLMVLASDPSGGGGNEYGTGRLTTSDDDNYNDEHHTHQKRHTTTVIRMRVHKRVNMHAGRSHINPTTDTVHRSVTTADHRMEFAVMII